MRVIYIELWSLPFYPSLRTVCSRSTSGNVKCHTLDIDHSPFCRRSRVRCRCSWQGCWSRDATCCSGLAGPSAAHERHRGVVTQTMSTWSLWERGQPWQQMTCLGIMTKRTDSTGNMHRNTAERAEDQQPHSHRAFKSEMDRNRIYSWNNGDLSVNQSQIFYHFRRTSILEKYVRFVNGGRNTWTLWCTDDCSRGRSFRSRGNVQ